MTGQGNKMDILKRSRIILEFTDEMREDLDFEDFFEYHDLGVPMAIALVNEFISLTETGIEVVNETYEDICNIYGANVKEDYETLEDLIDWA